MEELRICEYVRNRTSIRLECSTCGSGLGKIARYMRATQHILAQVRLFKDIPLSRRSPLISHTSLLHHLMKGMKKSDGRGTPKKASTFNPNCEYPVLSSPSNAIDETEKC